MNKLEEIEQQFNFKYPEIYRQLYRDEMLDWFHGWNEPWTKERNWFTEIYPTLLDNPPLLLWGNDFEMLEFDEIIEEIAALKDPEDFRATKPEFQFVPFAKTGGGDLYVFQFDKQQGDNVPVTLVPHDWEEATILAKNLQDFIFRKLLECVTVFDEYSKVKNGDLKTNLLNMLRTHKPYLSQSQVAKVEEIYNRNEGEFSTQGLISRDELKEILEHKIGFEDLDKEFVYMG